MSDPRTEIDAIEELETAWSQAEMGADTGTLDAISTPDFMLVGPLGFVLDKQQWLERYLSGDLVTDSLSLEDPAIRVYGRAAVVIARHIQQASYKGQPADGQFRTTHIVVQVERRWLLAGIQLSPIGGPPPFARPAEREAHVISREELRAAIDNARVTVVDALPPAAFGQRHLPGAINVVAENSDEQVRAALPDPAAAIVAYSTDEHCTRGPELAGRLRELGYRDVRTYEGGIADWVAAGLPVLDG